MTASIIILTLMVMYYGYKGQSTDSRDPLLYNLITFTDSNENEKIKKDDIGNI